MKCAWKTTVSFTIWMAGLPLAAKPAEIRVRLQDYAEVPAGTIHQAKEVASLALASANVTLIWVECAIREDKPSRDPVCRLPITPQDLQLRVIDKEMAKRTHKRFECMGYAVLTDGQGSIASIFLHKAEELAALNIASLGEILGGMIAHEIGHLLGIRQHSRQGLMRAVWDDHNLRELAKGLHGFTGEEASRVASCAFSRISARD